MERVEPGPAVARQRVRERLRELRLSQGKAPAEVAEAMTWSLSKLNRIENGVVTITPVEVEALLRLYGVSRPDAEVSELMELARISRIQKWWNISGLSAEFQEFVAYETEASVIYNFQALFMPPMLQTLDYAQSVTATIRRMPKEDAAVASVVNLRRRRQKEFYDRMEGPHPPKLVAALDESVLLRPVGGVEVMRAQLDHLIVMAKHPNIKLIIVPLKIEGHPGLGGPFELLEFSQNDPDVLFVESAARDWIEKNSKLTSNYREVMRILERHGLKGASATRAIRDARAQLTN